MPLRHVVVASSRRSQPPSRALSVARDDMKGFLSIH